MKKKGGPSLDVFSTLVEFGRWAAPSAVKWLTLAIYRLSFCCACHSAQRLFCSPSFGSPIAYSMLSAI
jgi:hypothetical protein